MTSGFWTGLAAACVLVLAWAQPLESHARQPAAEGNAMRLAAIETPRGTSLDDIVNARVPVGFSPVVEGGLHVVGLPTRSMWLRLQSDSPADGRPRYVTIHRQAIERLRLYRDQPGLEMVAETGFSKSSGTTRWPDYFSLQLPPDAYTVYLEVQGSGHLNLQPRILSQAQFDAQAMRSTRIYAMLYGGLTVLGLVALLRRASTGERYFPVALAAFACLVASLVGNYHLQLTVGGTNIASLPSLPNALWIMACAPLIWSTRQYSGHARNLPALAVAMDRLGLAFLAIGLLLLMAAARFVASLQVVSLVLMIFTAASCAIALAFDPRQWRWSPIVVWMALVPALMIIPLSLYQILPFSVLVRRGFQFLLGLQLTLYLLLPWTRQVLQKRASLKRSQVVDKSTEEKIAHAREWMLNTLQASLETAAQGDVQWIAYARLMGGLKPVLAQTGAAVIAMNYHNEDLFLVDSKTAEPRFRMLLAQRGSLLKNLSRSLAPQQIGVDYNGPDGPLLQVPLAIIPLPIDRPGWGALVIERVPGTMYSDEQLDLCTEFAALATTASDEAADVMQRRHSDEIDADTGVYKPEMVERVLDRARAQSAKKRTPLSVLCVGVDDFDSLPADAIGLLMHSLAEVLREETDYGETVARAGAGEMLAILPGRQIGAARLLGERICKVMREKSLPIAPGGRLLLSVGAAQLQGSERDGTALLERATKAMSKARQYGGNQVQAIATTGF